MVPIKAQETKPFKPEKRHEVAPTLYVPIPVSFADDPAALHARHSYWCRKMSISIDWCRLVVTFVYSCRLLVTTVYCELFHTLLPCGMVLYVQQRLRTCQ